MTVIIDPKRLSGTVAAIPSKSATHRALICAALADGKTILPCPDPSLDIWATARSIEAFGAGVIYENNAFAVTPIKAGGSGVLPCGESGSTLRFLLPVAGALGGKYTFLMEKGLALRPLSPLDGELKRMGVTISRDGLSLTLTGRIRPGAYRLPGDVSSQFISGLLLALPLLDRDSTVTIAGPLESAPYVDMTTDMQRAFQVFPRKKDDTYFLSPASYRSPGELTPEGDWSSAAFWLGGNFLGNALEVRGLREDSLHGDRAITNCLSGLGHGNTVSLAHIPDLAPILSICAACAPGLTRFTDGKRLRLKESDRIQSITEMLTGLGGQVNPEPDGFTVLGTGLTGGTVDAKNDHRIAMAAAMGATVCKKPVTILGAQAVNKSYPGFWLDYESLGGRIEIR